MTGEKFKPEAPKEVVEEPTGITAAHHLGLKVVYERPKAESPVATWDFMKLKTSASEQQKSAEN